MEQEHKTEIEEHQAEMDKLEKLLTETNDCLKQKEDELEEVMLRWEES